MIIIKKGEYFMTEKCNCDTSKLIQLLLSKLPDYKENAGQIVIDAKDLIKTMKKYEDLPPITGVKTKL